MDIEIIKTYEGFLKLSPYWNSVLAKSEDNNLFLTFEWLSCWWEIFGGGRNIFVLVAREDSEVIGLAPLMITRRGLPFLKAESIEFIGAAISDYQGFIITKNKKKVVEAFFSTILKYSKLWSYFYIKSITENSKSLSIIREILPEKPFVYKIRDSNKAYFLPLKSKWEEQHKMLKRNIKSDIKKRINRLNREGELKYFVISENDDLRRYLPIMFEQHKKRWMEKEGKKSKFYEDGYKKFFHNIAQIGLEKGVLNLTCLKLNETVIAFHFGFCYNKVFYYYIPTFNSEFKVFSPGKVLIYYMLRDQTQRNIKEFDFLFGKEVYKSGWTEEYRKIFSVYAARDTLCGRAIFYWITVVRARIKNLVPKKYRLILSK